MSEIAPQSKEETLMPMPFLAPSKRTLESVKTIQRTEAANGNQRGSFKFQADQEMSDSLRLEMQITSPAEQAKYEELWLRLNNGFLGVFGNYITDEQAQHFRIPPIIIGLGGVTSLERHWEGLIEQGDDKVSELNGKIYDGYHIYSEEEKKWSSDDKDDRSVCSITFGSGNLVVAKQLPDYYQSSAKELDFNFIASVETVLQNYGASARSLKRTHIWPYYERHLELVEVLLHDKIHSLQDPLMALPIQECATEYYVKLVFDKLGLPYVDDKRLKLARLYWSLMIVPEFAEMDLEEDLHTYMFNNLSKKKRKRVKHELYRRFTEQVIKDIFPKHKWITREPMLF